MTRSPSGSALEIIFEYRIRHAIAAHQKVERSDFGIIDREPHRGIAWHQRQFEQSVADYTASEAQSPHMASTYYVRGLARRQLGDAAQAEADIAKGIELEPGIVLRYSGYGVE